MKVIQQETITAIATAIVPQQGSIGIVRLSGENAIKIGKKIFSPYGNADWESHKVIYGTIRHPNTQRMIDECLLLPMLSPRSFTREDVVEIHCHGGMMLVQQILQLCLEEGARLAEAGEFTLRAFLNGRIDLTQAESIAELVGAQSIQASQMAIAGLQGKLATPIRQLRGTCLDILAEVEARIDFEDDLPPLDEAEIIQQLTDLLSQVNTLLATADRGELLRSGLKVAIVGRPNVGKSSLLNGWSRCDRAIVTDLPGTTRDIVESQLVVGGIPVKVLDTAGIRETADQVEKMGVMRSHQVAKNADLVLLTIDASQGWTKEDEEIYQQVKNYPVILVVNKIDLASINTDSFPDGIIKYITLSALKNQGIDKLETAILDAAKQGKMKMKDLDVAVNQRQEAALMRVKNALEKVQETINNDLPLDFWTIDLRSAIQALGEITGEEVTESVLDRIFSRFCIGK
ncbi:MAG: tRNA uridine-5-carboxymethylaminomethyl(34) synthesis GTPase MnmE [Microcystaceae cyanobacterium]